VDVLCGHDPLPSDDPTSDRAESALQRGVAVVEPYSDHERTDVISLGGEDSAGMELEVFQRGKQLSACGADVAGPGVDSVPGGTARVGLGRIRYEQVGAAVDVAEQRVCVVERPVRDQAQLRDMAVGRELDEAAIELLENGSAVASSGEQVVLVEQGSGVRCPFHLRVDVAAMSGG
jgi:hypothetical protein